MARTYPVVRVQAPLTLLISNPFLFWIERLLAKNEKLPPTCVELNTNPRFNLVLKQVKTPRWGDHSRHQSTIMKVKAAKHKGKLLMEINEKDSERLAAAGNSTLPFRVKRIVVPIDFSPCSKKALKYALPFARHFGATIILVNVIPLPSLQVADLSDVDLPFLGQQDRSANQKRLRKFVSDEIGELIPIEEVIRDGKPHLEIVEVAKQMEADLIIISTHGAPEPKRFFLGSVAKHVVRNAPCPVLVVREKETDFV